MNEDYLPIFLSLSYDAYMRIFAQYSLYFDRSRGILHVVRVMEHWNLAILLRALVIVELEINTTADRMETNDLSMVILPYTPT